MRLRCTNVVAAVASVAHRRDADATRARRGVAEIETLLVIIFVVLPILFIVVFAGALGTTRLENIYNAENNAYAQVVSGASVGDPDFVPVAAAVQPDIPTRFAVSNQVSTVLQTQGGQSAALSPVKIEDKAWFLDSSWHYPSSGDGPTAISDQKAIYDWFNAYVNQDHSAALDYALGISPPGPP